MSIESTLPTSTGPDDFAENLVQEAIEHGNREARGEIRTGSTTLAGQPRFRKELGEPVFWETRR